MSVRGFGFLALTCFVLAALVVGDHDNNDDDHPCVESKWKFVTAVVSLQMLLSCVPVEFGFPDSQTVVRGGHPHIERRRKYVNEIMAELGPAHVRRAHRMPAHTFWELHVCRTLLPFLSSCKKKQTGAKNGIVTSPIRLSAAIRHFAGGRPEDVIAVVHGISHSTIFESVWFTVDGVLNCPALDICFPPDHEKQRKIADGFASESRAGCDCCVGSIDDVLIWIEKLTNEQCKAAGCGGPKDLFCGRKHKCGLNMQAVCDSQRRFLDVSIFHPAATSDFLAFATSSLCTLLETEGFLADGLCLFGDAECVKNSCMCSPFKNAGSGIKDDFNYHHSSTRINIKCALGTLVKLWGIIRRAFPRWLPASSSPRKSEVRHGG